MLRVLAVLAFVFSADAASAERRIALVIGEDDYRVVRPLENAVADAQSIENTLDSLGFEVTLETNRDLRRLRRALDDFREDGEGADVALVFFAGHGVEISGENRLLPVDADASSLQALQASTLPLEEVRAAVADVAAIGLIILDACRNDPFGATSADGGRGVVAIAGAREVKPGLGRIGRAEGVLFAFSAAPGETASDGAEGHSPFAAALVKYLGTDGVEVRSALTLVQQEVYDVSRGKQLPYVESGLPKLFFASTTRDELPERERLLLAMADVTPDLRAEVEAIAAERDMPLAPLYGALIDADAAPLGGAERVAKLTEAADAFVKVRDEMKALASADPAVEKLRSRAEEQLALGAFDTARVELAAAAEIDSQSREKLKSNYLERTLSEAATRYVSGGAAEAELRYDLAIADLEKAVALYAEAGDKLPAEHADRRLSTLLGLGKLYTKVGDIAAAERAYTLLRDFAFKRVAENPADPVVKRDLAIAQRSLGNARVAQGNLSAALEAFRAELAVLVEVVTASPKPQWVRELGIAHDDIGQVLMTQGDLDGALAAFRNSLELKLALAEADPDDAQRQRDLTIAYDEIGGLLDVKGDPSQALVAYEASRDVRQRLAAAEPEDNEAQRDLSVSHDKVGDLLRDRKEFDAALASYAAGRAIIRKVVARDPQNAGYRRDLGVSAAKVGNVQRDMGDLDAALASFRESLDMLSALAASDPHNMDWQRDVSIGLEKMADVLSRQGDVEGSLDLYLQSLPIMESLVATDPTNANWQRDLSITLDEIGRLRMDTRDYGGAAEALAASLEIRDRLAGSQPDNARWQHDLILALVQYSRVARNPKELLTRALDIAVELRDTGRLPAKADNTIPALQRMIATLDAKKK